MERQSLNTREKQLLTFIIENNNSFPKEQDGFTKDERRAILKELIRRGIFHKDRPAFTNRGICRLIVDCNILYSTVKKLYADSFGAASAAEEKRAKEALGDNDDYINIFFFYKFRKYLQWDQFDALHYIRPIPDSQLASYNIEMCQDLLEDGRIPVDSVCKLYRIPPQLFASMGMDKSKIKDVLKMARSYL